MPIGTLTDAMRLTVATLRRQWRRRWRCMNESTAGSSGDDQLAMDRAHGDLVESAVRIATPRSGSLLLALEVWM